MPTRTSISRNVGNIERAASVGAGSLLVWRGLRHFGWAGAGLAVTGAALIARGITGKCMAYRALGLHTNSTESPGQRVSVPYGEGVRIDRSVTVNRPRFEVYSFWRNVENLPQFMEHLERVRQLNEKQSHWVARTGGKNIEWDAEIINDLPGELIGWRSLPGSEIDNAGSIHFRDAAGNRGTEVRVEMQYVPPLGPLGAFAAKLFGPNPAKQVEEDLRRFKMMLETGEVSAAKPVQSPENKQQSEKDVLQASVESFPASDAPAWT